MKPNVHCLVSSAAKIGLKVLASEAVGASMRKMMKEVKSSSFDNRRFTTLPMLSVNAPSKNQRLFTLPKFYYSCKIAMYYTI